MEGEGVVAGRGKFRGAPRPPNNPTLLSKGRANRLTPCALAGALTYNACFTHPFIHTLLFVSRACSSGVPVTYSGGVPVVFQQKLFLKPTFLRHTMWKMTNMKVPVGRPEASKQHIFLSCLGLVGG